MARLPKAGVATVAALFALVVGVEVASAGLIDEVVEDPAAAVEAPVAEVTQAADEAVADAKQAVDEAVADAPGTVETVTEAAKYVVADTPAAPVVNELERVVDPVAKTVSPIVDKAIDPVVAKASEPAEALKAGSNGPSSASSGTGGSTPTESSAAGAPANISSRTGNPTSYAQPNSVAAAGSSTATQTLVVSTGGLLQVSQPLPTVPVAAPETPAEERHASSNAPLAPFAPLFPVGPAAAASAGAAGAALTAALLAAFMLLAPRTGRLARPGPKLVRAEPCLSLPERPG